MSELTKQALRVDNNQSFPNNNAGLITPTNLRTFNENMIDSLVDEIGYNADSASFNNRINALSGSGGTANTGSLLTTASFDNNTRNLTFTKGNSSTFSVNIPDASGSILPSGVVSGSSQVSYPLLSNIPAGIVSGSSQLTSSFVTLDTTQTITGRKSFAPSPDGSVGISMQNATRMTFGSGATNRISSPDSNRLDIETINGVPVSGSPNTINVISGVSGSTSGDASIINIETRGLQVGQQVAIRTTDFRVVGNTGISGSLNVSSSLSHALTQGNVLVGDVNGRTQAIPTSSFGGGGSINTGSFATTGSNTFIGNQDITGSLKVSSSVDRVVLQAPNFSNFNPTDLGGVIVSSSFSVTGDMRVGGATRFAQLDVSKIVGNGGQYSVPSGLAIIANVLVYNDSDINQPRSLGVSGSAFVSQSIQVGGDLTASLQQGYVWVGNSSGKTTTLPTSSFAGVLPSGLLSSSVTNFTDYSASVDTRINNIVAGTGFATTGSNTFTGNQNIQGTITASLQEGFALVGGVGNVSTLVATSSFGGGGAGFPFTGDAVITGSLTISSSLPIDLDVIGGARITGSLLLTGSSIFTGDQTFVDGAGNTITLSDASGSLMLVAKTFTSASAHLTASAGNQVNIIFKNNNNTTDTIISGSNNLFTNPTAPAADFKRIIGSNNIVNSATGTPQVTGSMTTPITMASNYFGSGTTTIRGPVTGSGYTISNNAIFGTLNLGAATLNDVTRAQGFTFTGNQVIGTMGFVSTTSATLPTLASAPIATNNIVNGALTATLNSSSISLTTNIITAGGFNITNNNFNGTGGTGVLTVGNNIVGGAQFTTLAVQGSNPVGTTNNPAVQGNLIYGLSNATHINADNSRVSGTNVYTNLTATAILGSNLAVTGSSLTTDTTSVGSAFVGRFNVNDGIRNKTSEIVFAVGTGTATGTRKTGFLIDSGSNTFVEGTLNVSGSSVFTGSLILSSSAATELQVIGNTEFTGSVKVAPTFQLQLPTGSNQQAGTAVLDGANPGAVVVSNSLVTANSIIMVSKQTLTNSHMVAVSAKGAGTFTITSNGNGDTDTVGWFIINNS